MSGSIGLAGKAALRSGAGLVTLAVPDSILDTVAAYDPCYMTLALPDATSPNSGVGAVDASVFWTNYQATSIGVGPGLGTGDGASALVRTLVEDCPLPLVLDADSLNIIAQTSINLGGATGPRIVTPHPGEFRRLVDQAQLDVQALRDHAVPWAAQNGVVLVLKGHHTIVTDGQQRFENPTGNPGMATGGSGDVLTGVITALLGQGLAPFAAAQLGVYVHGLAADLAADDLGMISLVASDLVRYLSPAFQHIHNANS